MIEAKEKILSILNEIVEITKEPKKMEVLPLLLDTFVDEILKIKIKYDNPENPDSREGHEKLWGWFSLSRASWLTIPRVLLHEMSDSWQGKLADLLIEYDDTWEFDELNLGTKVQCTDYMTNKIVKTPEWLINYRHPDKGEVDTIRKEKD